MFEHHSKSVLPMQQFRHRVLRYLMYSILILGFSLGIGMAGYHFIAYLTWLDSFYNASMILTGMGPVNPMTTDGAKFFSGCYALFSGIAFLSTVAVLFAPVAHRFLHIMQIDDEQRT
ncbi:MAG: hypothetical protein IPL46_29360 [Saprospiraceae bacterium]|nr:hypothetical protein [Saprospiraceae bacterium]